MNDQNPEDDAQNHVSVKDLKSRFEANKKANKQPEFVPGKNAAHTGEKKLANATWIKNKQEKEEQEEEAQRSTQENQQQAEKPKEDHSESDVKNRIARFNQLSKKEDAFEDLKHRKELAKAKAISKQKDGHEEGHEAGEHNEHQEHHEHHDNNKDEESRENRVPSEKVVQFDTHVKDKIQFFSKTKVEEHQTHIPKWRVGPSGEQIAVDEHGNDVVEHHNDEHNKEHGEEIPGANVQEKIKIYSHDGVELEEEHHREKVEPQPGDENGRNHEDEMIAEGIVQEKVEYFSKRTPEEEELERRRERGELDHAEGHERGTNEGDEENREVQNLEAHYVENSENNENPNKAVEGQNFVEKEQVDELQDVDVQEKIDLYSRTAAPNELPEKKNRSKKQNGDGQNAGEEEEVISGNNEGEEQVEEKVAEVEQITVENYQSQEAVVIESQGNQEEQIETVVTEENYQTEKGDVKEKIKVFSHENKEQTQRKKKNNKNTQKAEDEVENNEQLEKEERVVEELEEQVQETEVKEQEQQLQEEQTVVENNEVAQEANEEDSAIQKGNTQDKIKMFSQQGNQETYQPKKKHNKKHNQEGERKNSTQSRENEDAAVVEEEAEIQQIEEQRAYNEVQEVINQAERVEAEARKQEELQLKQQEQEVEREIEEAEEEIKRIEKSEVEKGDVQGKIKMFSNNENKETYQPKKLHHKKKNQKESEGSAGENVQVEEGETLVENEEEVEHYASEEQGKTEQNEEADNQENIETENVEDGNNQEIAGIEKGSVRQKAGLYSHEKKEDTFTGGRKHHEGKTKNTETETNEDVNIETTEEVIVEQNTAEAEENAEENKEIQTAESKGNKKKNKKKQNKNKNKNKQNVDEINQDSEDGQVVSDEVVPEEPSNEPETIIEETNQPESNVKKIIESGVFAHQPTHHHHLHHETAPHQTEEVSVAVEENNVENSVTEQQEQRKEEEIVQNIPQESLAQEIVEIVKEEEQPVVQEKREDVSEGQSNEQAVEYHSHHHHHHQQSVETVQVEIHEQEKLTEEVQAYTQETQEQHTSSQQNYTEVYSEPTYTSTYVAEAKVVEESRPVQSAQVNQSYASSQEGLNARFVVEETRENVVSEPQGASEWKSRESHSEENEIVISREAPVADKPKAHIQRTAAVYREQEADHEPKKSSLPYQDTTTSAHHTRHETYNITVTQQSNQQVSENDQGNQQGSAVHGQNTYFAGQPQSPSTFAELDKSAGFAGNSSQTLYEIQRESYSTLGQNPQYNQSNRPSENSFGQFGTSGVKFSIPENKNNRLPTFPPMVDDSINEDLKSDKSRLLEVNTISDHESKVMSENASAHRNSGPGNRGLGSNVNTFVEGDNTSHVHIIQPVQIKRESVVQEKPVSKRPTSIEQVPLNQSQQQQEEAYEQIREDNNLEQPLLGNKQNNKPKADLNLHKPQAKGCCAALCAIFTGK